MVGNFHKHTFVEIKNSGPRVSKGSNAVVIKTVVLSVYLSK